MAFFGEDYALGGVMTSGLNCWLLSGGRSKEMCLEKVSGR